MVEIKGGTVDGSEIRLPVEVGKYTIIYKVLYIPGGAGFQPSTVSRGYGPLPENTDDRLENHHYLIGDISSNVWGNPASHVSFPRCIFFEIDSK